MFFGWLILILFPHGVFCDFFEQFFPQTTEISIFFSQIITWLFIIRGEIVPKWSMHLPNLDFLPLPCCDIGFFLAFFWTTLKNTTNRSERVQMSRFISTDNRELKIKCLATQPVTDSLHWICSWIFNAQHWYVFVLLVWIARYAFGTRNDELGSVF